MQVLSNIGQFLLVVAVSFVVISLIVSFIRFQNIARRSTEADNAIDPHDAFQVQIANRLGTAHLEPGPFLVMMLAPDTPPPPAAPDGQDAGVLLDRIKQILRGADTVVHVGGGRVGVVVDAAYENAEGVARRILDGVRKESLATSSGNVGACVGIAAHPEHGNRVKALMEHATAALQAALVKGRGQFVVADVEGVPPSTEPGAGGAGSRAVVDPLTGVLRQERLGIALQKYVAQYRKQGDPVSVLVLEVDHFERYSEHYGPTAGDDILRKLGEILQGSVRESDLIGRPEENTFLISMGCAPRDAVSAAQRISAAVKKAVFPAGGSSLRITISSGVAGYPDHGGHPRQLLEFADAALAAAREKGRNMCLLYESSMKAAKKGPGPAEMF